MPVNRVRIAFCAMHAAHALSSLLAQQVTAGEHYRLFDASESESYQCRCGKRAKFYMHTTECEK